MGNVKVFEDLEDAVANAWLVVEAVPEKLELKISTFASLEQIASKDCILATNSSSYKSSEMITQISEDTKRRVLNTHYYMPPENMVVELMTDGFTDTAIFSFLSDRFRESGAKPYVARKESTGFIFNRLWAAVKRETLTILSEGVSDAEEIDSLWEEMFIKGGARPCKTMDQVGLDTVAFIEGHYIAERGLSSTHTTDFLKTNYLDQGKLGNKSDKGGLYPPKNSHSSTNSATQTPTTNSAPTSSPTLFILDSGLSNPSLPPSQAGSILRLSPPTNTLHPLTTSLPCPDGIAIDPAANLIFYTCMGDPGAPNGTISSCTLTGTNHVPILPPGTINTPKQLTLDPSTQTIYFADREACTISSCSYTGTRLTTLIHNPAGTLSGPTNALNWCVGIAISLATRTLYWTQKGGSKSDHGRIFTAGLDMPAGCTAETRDDVRCIAYGLPEPIDLALDATHARLYWTDRGELPWGNSLNRIDLGDDGLPVLKPAEVVPRTTVVARGFHEAIGLAVDADREEVWVADLGGAVYVCGLDGGRKRTVVREEGRAFTGLAVVG